MSRSHLYVWDASSTDLASATRGGELCLPCCTVSIISGMGTEHVYNDQTQAGVYGL